MAQITTIKEDELGMFVIAGGYISRPFYGTKFQVGDKVKTHHFSCSTNAGVTVADKPETHHFKKEKGGQFEYWCTTGLSSYDMKKKSKAEIKEQTEWYKKGIFKPFAIIYTNLNLNFEK